MRVRPNHGPLDLAAAFLLCAVPVIASRADAQLGPQPTHILLLYAPSPEGKGVVDFTRRLRAAVRNEVASPVEFYDEYLDLDRFPGRDRWPQLARYFADKYRGFRFDVVVAVGSVALRFATDPLRELLPGVPVVFAITAEDAVDVSALPANTTGRLMPTDFASTLALARRLQPDAERVVIIAGGANVDSLHATVAVAAAAPFRDSIQLVLLRGQPYDELLGSLRRLPPRTIVLLASLQRDGRGRVFDPAEATATIVRESRAPVYSIAWAGDGIVGGAVTSLDDEGARTGELVVRVLRRRPGEPMPPPVTAGTGFVADWRQLRRWGLSERRLPPGTEVLFREPSVWERYRAPILTTLGIIAAESLLIVLLLLERRRRIHAQLVVAEQAAYEQTMADLTTDAVRHAPEETPRALEDALARIGRYASASAAVLVERADDPSGQPTRHFWTSPTRGANGNGSPPVASSRFHRPDVRLEIPLVADGTPVGVLELYRSNHTDEGWPERIVRRLDAAADLIAAALARSRAATAIRRGEEINRAVLASLSMHIAILDRKGTIIRVNEAWRESARRSGVDPSRDAFVGENYLDQCRRAEQRGFQEAHEVRLGIEAVLKRETRAFRYEYQISSPKASQWYELSVEPLEYTDGGAVVAHLDITDRRLAEIRADETRRQVAHMGRLAVVGELAATVSHELRQPLAAIRTNAEAGALLLADAPELSEVRAILKDIVDDDVRASDIIDNIRMLLRKEEPTTRAVDLNEICSHAAQLLKGDAMLRGARLELRLEPQLPPVAGDPVQLQQVVLNLALNALDATAGSAGEHEVTVGTVVRGNEAELFVRDTGPGLTAELQEHLFESFYTTKAQGLGLGLVIVRSIVERHHGRVYAETAAGRGAIFRVLLPVPPVSSIR